MITADLEQKATLGTMVRLISDESEAIEAPGHEPTTTAEEFEGRNGYSADFLMGWHIALPKATGAKAADMRELRRGGTGVELRYQNFSSILSMSRRMPMITAVNISGRESRSLPRINTWSFDGRLDKTDQWGDELYAGNALDRGHMVRREDPVWGTFEEARQANVDTFHFTNSCPQMAAVNQKTWVGLENYVLQHARADQMRVSVFTGPYFSDSDLHYRGALVPKAFWKVVAIITETGRPSATAYKVSQEQELQELEFVFGAYKTYQISVRQVMADTGIDFSDLVPFDGFSTEEANTGNSMTETLETLASIRI